jgi:hypothetical protein
VKFHQLQRPFFLGAAALLLAACAGADPDESSQPEPGTQLEAEPAAPAETPDEARFDKRDKRGKRGKHGLSGLIRASLDELDLSDPQRAEIDAIAAELKSGKDKSARKEMRAALASAVQDGNLADAEIAQAKAAVLTKAEDKAQKLEKALQELHGVLRADQRKALVASLEQRFGSHADRAGKRGKSHKRGDKMRGKHMGHMAEELGLDDAQRAKWSQALEALPGRDKQAMGDRFAEMKERTRTMMQAFAADDFQASKLGLVAVSRDKAAAGIDHRVAELRALLSVLDSTQATQLGEILQTKSNKRGR